MRTCVVCKEAVQRRNKDGWSVLARPGWFAKSCEGHPLAVMPSPPEEIQQMRPDVIDEGPISTGSIDGSDKSGHRSRPHERP